ncbi:fucose-specific lectin [Hypoxylon sp. NC1633]|nr:fucose-specific lectin [Hypoxylon sp. NC1633]
MSDDRILPGTSVASTAFKTWECAVFYQGMDGGIRHSVHRSAEWISSSNTLFKAKLFTPLAVISWKEGNEIRVYCLSDDNILQEWVWSGGSPWVPGYLSKLGVRVNPSTRIAALNWDGPNIRVYCQEAGSNAIQEYCNGDPWYKGFLLPTALNGSSIAAGQWRDPLYSVHLRVYTQAPDRTLREHCYDGKWTTGAFRPGEAPQFTTISALVWSGKLRVYWQNDDQGLVEDAWESSGWSSNGVILKSMRERASTGVLDWNDSRDIRIYYQSSKDSTIRELCSEGDGWIPGAIVAGS